MKNSTIRIVVGMALVLCLLCAWSAVAEEVQVRAGEAEIPSAAGEIIHVQIIFTNPNGFAGIQANVTASDGLVYQSTADDSGWSGANHGRSIILAMDPTLANVRTSVTCTLTYRLRDDVTQPQTIRVFRTRISTPSGKSVSGNEVTVRVTPNAHTCTYGDWIVRTMATCQNDGVQYRVCGICSTAEIDIIPATGHTLGAPKLTVAPTCTASGTSVITCTVCGDVCETNTEPALGHSVGEWIVNPEEGVQTQSCLRCGECLARIPLVDETDPDEANDTRPEPTIVTPETPSADDPETPPVVDPETPPTDDPEMPPVVDPETPPTDDPVTIDGVTVWNADQEEVAYTSRVLDDCLWVICSEDELSASYELRLQPEALNALVEESIHAIGIDLGYVRCKVEEKSVHIAKGEAFTLTITRLDTTRLTSSLAKYLKGLNTLLPAHMVASSDRRLKEVIVQVPIDSETTHRGLQIDELYATKTLRAPAIREADDTLWATCAVKANTLFTLTRP